MRSMTATAKALPKIRRFDPGADLPEQLAEFVWAWEGARGAADAIPERAAFNLLRLPNNGAQAGFVLVPFAEAGGDLYRWRVVGNAAKERLSVEPGAAIAVSDPIAQAALEALLTATPMQIAHDGDGAGWTAMLAPLASADGHVIVGIVV